MTICRHELKQGRISLLIWTAAIAFMIGVCILIFPEMESQMTNVSDMFADMGSFSAAFGMDRINFGEFTGFFCVECGNVLGLGGAFFAALLGISMLSKEEKEHTAEFLFTHPISRKNVIAQKLMAVVLQIIFLNVVTVLVTIAGIMVIGEDASVKELTLMFLAYFIMQLEIAAITFGVSAFLKRGSIGIGLGLATVFYFVNMISNLTEDAKFLKFFTPFGYTDGADIIEKSALDIKYLTVGIIFAIVGIIVAFWQYTRKDVG